MQMQNLTRQFPDLDAAKIIAQLTQICNSKIDRVDSDQSSEPEQEFGKSEAQIKLEQVMEVIGGGK